LCCCIRCCTCFDSLQHLFLLQLLALPSFDRSQALGPNLSDMFVVLFVLVLGEIFGTEWRGAAVKPVVTSIFVPEALTLKVLE